MYNLEYVLISSWNSCDKLKFEIGGKGGEKEKERVRERINCMSLYNFGNVK